MRYETPQAKNPNRMTINQHVFPRRSIARFAENGKVEVRRVGVPESFRVQPTDSISCARRVWDQKTERLSKPIEDRFQSLAEAVISLPNLKFTNNDFLAVTEFYALVLTRIRFREHPIDAKRLVGIEPGRAFSKDTQEFINVDEAEVARWEQMVNELETSIRESALGREILNMFLDIIVSLKAAIRDLQKFGSAAASKRLQDALGRIASTAFSAPRTPEVTSLLQKAWETFTKIIPYVETIGKLKALPELVHAFQPPQK